jgi:hypothetical protein
MDPDQHQIEMYYPDPHQCDTDPLRQFAYPDADLGLIYI